MKKRIQMFLLALLAITLCLFAFTACRKKKNLEAPTISGPTALSLYEGYEPTSSGAFTVTGDEVVVTKTSGTDSISWNDETKKLDIAAGLSAGEYKVVLTASNGDVKNDATAEFQLTVKTKTLPSITGPVSLSLIEGYSATATEAFTVAGDEVTVSVIIDTTNGKATWNDQNKIIEIAAGLEAGTYMVTLKASNGVPTEDVTHEFVIHVSTRVSISGPQSMTLLEGYEGVISTAPFTYTGSGVTIEKTSGDEKIAWNDETNCLDIEAGLSAGNYPVVLTASNGNIDEGCTFTFTLSVKQVYTVTGSYSYTSGFYVNDKYTVSNDEITIKSNDVEGVVNLSEQTYSITLPEGENSITLTSKYFNDVTLEGVTVENADTSIEEAVFSVPKLDCEFDCVSYFGNGFTVKGGEGTSGHESLYKATYHALNGDVTASGAFIISYTVKAMDTQGTYRHGAFVFQKNEKWYTLLVYINDNGRLMVRIAAEDNGVTFDNLTAGDWTIDGATYNSELNITLAYSNEAFYVKIAVGNTTKVAKMDESSAFSANNVDKEAFFGVGVRTLGFRGIDCDTMFTNVSYTIGDEAAQSLIDSLYYTVIVNDGEDIENGSVSLTESKAIYGSSVTVTVAPESGYAVTKFEVNGEDKLAELTNGEYVIANIAANVMVSVEFESVPFYTLTGAYSYGCGILANGAYTVENDTVTVKAGGYKGTASNGSYSVEVPAGTHTVTLTSKYFCDIVIANVEVTENGGTADSVIFNKPKLDCDADCVSYNENGFTVKGGTGYVSTYHALGGEVTTSGAFTISYSVKAMDTQGTYRQGAFVFQKDGKWYTLLVYINDSGRLMVRIAGEDKGITFDNLTSGDWTIEGATYDSELDITLAYSNEAFYVKITVDNTTKVVKMDESSAFSGNNVDKGIFFGTGTRTLGFRGIDCNTAFTNVSYAIGDEAAQSLINSLYYTVAVNDGEEVDNGSVALTQSKAIYGSSVIVTVTPDSGYAVKKFEVNGEDKLADLANGEYTIVNICGNVKIVVEFEVVPVYTLTGTYSYGSGISANGTYTVENDTVTVKVGSYEGTASNGSYTIEVPAGTYTVTLTSKYFCDIVISDVEVTSNGGMADGAVFIVPKLDCESDCVSYNENGFTVKGGAGYVATYHALGGEVKASGAFTISYAVKPLDTVGIYRHGAFVFQKGGSWYTLLVYINDSGRLMVRVAAEDNGITFDNLTAGDWTVEEASYNSELIVTLAYLDEAFYAKITVGNTTKVVKMDELSAFSANNVDKEAFFGAGVRTLGFRGIDCDTMFTNVSYAIGNGAAQSVIDSLYYTVTVNDGEDIENGSVSLTESSVIYGSSVTVTVTPDSGYAVKKFEVNGEDKLAELTNGEYSIANITSNVTVSVEFEVVPVYTLTGTYSYDFVTVAEDAVTVKAGSYEGTASNGSYTIEVPAGTHTVTLTSKYFRDIVIAGVQVTENGGTTDDVVFTVPKLDCDSDCVSYNENGFTVKGGLGYNNIYHALGGEVTASDAFTISYTVKAMEETGIYRHGAFVFQKDEKWYTLLVYINDNGRLMVRIAAEDNGVTFDNLTAGDWTIDGATYNSELDVTLAYLNGTFYVKITVDNTTKVVKMDESSAFSGNNVNKEAFFGTGTRTLGFRGIDCDTMFTNVSYAIGNEVAQSVIDSLYYSVNVNDGETVDNGTVTITVNSEEIANEGALYGSSVTVAVTPDSGYVIKTFEVNGEDKLSELTNGEYTIANIASDVIITVEFETTPVYTLTGTYTYGSGTLVSGVYTMESDTVTVKVGSYEGTASNGSYTIEVPAGTYTVTLSSKYFRDVVIEDVEVTENGGTVQAATLNAIKLDGVEDSVYKDGGFTLTNVTGGFVTTSGAFTVSYTMVTEKTGGTYQSGGGFCFKVNGTVYTLLIDLRDNRIMIRNGMGDSNFNIGIDWNNDGTVTGVKVTNTIDVTIVYSGQAFYVLLTVHTAENDNIVKAVKFDATTTFANSNNFGKDTYFGAGERTLAFRAFNGGTVAFTNVSYGIGDEAANAAIATITETSGYMDKTASATSSASAQEVALPVKREEE